MELLLIRHGQSVFNVNGTNLDAGLTDLGRWQATALAERLSSLPVDLWVCSPMRRAVETLAVVLATRPAPVEIWPDTHERVGGDMTGYSGMHAREVVALCGGAWSDGHSRERWWPAADETADAVDARIWRVAERLCSLGADRVAMIVHTVFGAGLLRRLAPKAVADDAFLHLASVTTLCITLSRGHLTSFNSTSHLTSSLCRSRQR